jgi:L-threonylcarbamoyladenylate synthase
MQTRTVGAAAEAVELLSQGEIVALPTETVYGLAGDATRPEAVAKIFEAKERPFFDPLIVHLPSHAWLEKLTRHRNSLAERLMERFWPGPLTILLPRTELVPDLVTSGLETVALRMSGHPVFREVITQLDRPLAAPSANRFGRISPTTASHVQAELDGRIPLILDGGACSHGIESTIVLPEERRLRILRSGPVTAEMLSEFGEVIYQSGTENPVAPGQLKNHYAPCTPLRLIKPGVWLKTAPVNHKTGLLAWREPAEPERFAAVEVLSAAGELREAAARLFSAMRRLDESGVDLIIAEPVPEEGLGAAIMDRLRKASAK